MVKRAVVVGVDDYSIQGQKTLRTCVNDANSMYWLLVDGFLFDKSQTFLYTDADASRSNILRSLRYIVTQSEPGDVACFYFSGHGGRTYSQSGNAGVDKFYETIIPSSGDHISDWELADIVDDLEPSAVNFTVILDSCHSGGMHETDEVQKTKAAIFAQEFIQKMTQHMGTLIPCGVCIPHDSDVLNNNVSNVTANGNGIVDLDEDPDKTLVEKSKSTLISACRFHESAYGPKDLGHSTLTKSFLDIVNQSDFRISHHELLEALKPKVADYVKQYVRPNATQIPQLRGQMNRMEEDFLFGWNDSR